MISIKEIKEIRERLGLTHIIIFGMIERDKNFVCTHGKSKIQAMEASQYGNNIKKILGWPLQLCNSKPLDRICSNCSFYKYPSARDVAYGGQGKCMSQPKCITRDKDDIACILFEPNV